MNIYKNIKSREWSILIVLATISLGIRIFLINQDLLILLEKLLQDDYFYYLQVGQNIASGDGMTYNGYPTNGVQPLYTIILAGLQLIYDKTSTIYISLYIVSIFTVLTGLFIHLIVREIHTMRVALIATGIWLFNPWIIFQSLSGIGTPIQIFFISILTYYLLYEVDYDSIDGSQPVVIGILLGMIFLSRQDGLFISIGFFLSVVIHRLTHFSVDFRRVHRDYIDLIKTGIVASAVVTSWLFWNVFIVGRLTPIAGDGIRSIRLMRQSYSSLVIESILQSLRFVEEFFTMYSLTFLQSIILLLFTLAPPLIIVGRDRKFIKYLLKKYDFIVIACILYFPFYWFYILGFRKYYSIFTSFLIVLTWPILVAEMINTKGIDNTNIKNYFLLLLVVVFSISFIGGGLVFYDQQDRIQDEQYQTANHINNNYPTSCRFGSIQSGVLQYFTPNHEVVHLGPVINTRTYNLRKENSLDSYIQDEINYYTDEPHSVPSSIKGSNITTAIPSENEKQKLFIYKINNC